MSLIVARRDIRVMNLLNILDRNIDALAVLSNGKVRVDGVIVGSGYVVKRGQTLVYDNGDQVIEPSVDRNMEVLYEDEVMFIVNKPAPLPVHPCGNYKNNTLIEILKKNGKEYFLNHRLDIESSGPLVFAKRREDASIVEKSIREAIKIYLVAVHGNFPHFLKIDMPLGKKINSNIGLRQGKNIDGKKCLTYFKKIRYKDGLSLLMAKPSTGRKHQLRAHLYESGFPVFGDKIYGLDENIFLEYLEHRDHQKSALSTGLYRQFLHCSKITFSHPVNGKKMVVKAPLPIELRI